MGFVVVAATFTGCGNSMDPTALTYEKVTDKELGVEFEKPTGWYENIDSETDPNLYQYIVPNQFSQSDRVEGFLAIYKMEGVDAEEGSAALPLEDVYKVVRDSKMESSKTKEDYSVVADGKDVTIAGQPAKEMVTKFSMKAQDDKVPTYDSFAVVVIGSNTYLLEYYDEEGDYNKYMGVKEKLYSTLKEL